MSDQYDVFLSHSEADQSTLEPLAGRLQHEAGLRPFFRRWHLIPGEVEVRGVERGLENSSTVAVFIGPEGPDAWRESESQLALIHQADRRIIPVLLPGASEEDLVGFLRTRTWVNMTEDDGFERLVAGITGKAPELATGFDPAPILHKRLETTTTVGPKASAHAARPTPYTVYLASTSRDGDTTQPDLFETIRMVGMVAYHANEPDLTSAKERLSKADLFVMVVGWRYGKVPSGETMSMLELQYQWACELKLPRIVLMVDELRPIVVGQHFDEPPERWSKQDRLQALKARLEEHEQLIRFTEENIGAKLTHCLHQWRSNGAGTGPKREETSRSKKPRKATTKTTSSRPRQRPSSAQPRTRKRKTTRSKVPHRTHAQQRARYLEIVEEQSSTSTVFGPRGPVSLPLRLDELTVEVHLEPDHDSDSRVQLHHVFEHATRNDRVGVVLVGPPGSGKSTQLRRIALWLSRRSPMSLGLPVDTVPIVVSLHKLPDQIDSWRDALFAQLRTTSGLGPGSAELLLRTEHPLFLVDGFDELPTEKARERSLKWIEQALQEHPHARFVVTQRPNEPGADVSWPATVLHVRLPPMGEAEAKGFVEQWFRALEPDSTEPDGARKADALWAQLKAPEFRTTRMVEFARNPLMLAVLCVLHHERGQLPARRVELYEQCVQVLVRQWCASGNLPRRFGDREARQILQPLAHWLHEQPGRTYADGTAVAAAVEEHVKATMGYESVDGQVFLDEVAQNNGILQTKGPNSYGLLHLCFQEYLCARHLRSLSHRNPEVLDTLADRFGDPWWREVTILLLALGEPALFDPFVRRVLERPSFVEHIDWLVECTREAAQSTLKPFEDLLQQPAGDDREHWKRQLGAAQLLEHVEPERLVALSEQLREHPLEQLRRLVPAPESPAPRLVVSARSGYGVVHIPGGRFRMGSHHRERGRRGDEGPRHHVELGPYAIGKYPVTNEEYGHYLRARPQAAEPTYWADSRYNKPRQPVVGVSWHDAQAYCQWAGLSLPTEAQWEHACRAGTQTAYWSGRRPQDLERVGWVVENSEGRLHPVGERDPNPFGLHDMHGNIWEWCLDSFGHYSEAPPRATDGLRHPPLEDGNRVIRGGSWIDPARKARSAYRLNRHADNTLAYLGFRAVEMPHDDDDD